MTMRLTGRRTPWGCRPVFYRSRARPARRVGVAVLRADHYIVVAGILENIRQVVVGLAGHIDAVFSERVLADRLLSPLQPPRDIVQSIGDPLRAHLDEAEL